jgi:beta-glucosidase
MSFTQPNLDRRSFPSDFVWGVATSAFQIEGAASTDGRGLSTWDTFCRKPGAIADASNGDIACDHYHRWQSDLDIIASLGVNGYRFSVSWPRIQPSGMGAWNEKGLAFYDRLIDGLLERGVQPYLTLNHWDLPDELQQLGGWVNRDTTHRFVDYAREVGRRMCDRVKSITTHNEPWVISTLGYEQGIFAPGLKDQAAAMQASHHLLLSHGMAMQALRADGVPSDLGIVLNLSPMHPATDDQADIDKAKLEDGRLVRWYMDPLFGKGYPEDVLQFLGKDAPKVLDGDMAVISETMDFLGLNYYSRSVVSAKGPWDVHRSGRDVTDMGWEVYPEGLTELLLRLDRDYDVPPLFVTENGGAFKDTFCNGQVNDHDRTAYIAQHIAAVAEAMRRGVKMGGYMVWSLLDNFEWASGYEKRFGIVHVDYETQERTLKNSALWYQGFLTALVAGVKKTDPLVGTTQERLAVLETQGV